MVTQIGVVAGIQVLSTLQGGETSASSFTVAYLVGGAMAIVGLVASCFVQSAARQPALAP
jgi:hypothetical protein